MQENSLFKKGLLYLLYSVSLADGVHDKMEKTAIENIRKNEKFLSTFIKSLSPISMLTVTRNFTEKELLPF